MADQKKQQQEDVDRTKSAGRKAGEQQQAETQTVGQTATPTEGTIVRRGENIDPASLGSQDEGDQIIVPKEDIIEEFTPANAKRPSYRLLFPKGVPVRVAAIRRRLGQTEPNPRPTTSSVEADDDKQ